MHMIFTPHLDLAASRPSHVGKGLLPGEKCLDSLRIILAVTMVPTGAPPFQIPAENAHIDKPTNTNIRWFKKGRTWPKAWNIGLGRFVPLVGTPRTSAPLEHSGSGGPHDI
jgi:hypothetical protein